MPFGDPSSPGRGVEVDRATLSMAGRPRLLDELAVESIRSVHGTDTGESVGLMLEAHDDVVGVSDHDHVARGLAPSPAFGPEIEDVVEVDVRETGRDHRALSRPLLLDRHDPVFEGTVARLGVRRRSGIS